jgi:predicted ATPase
MPSWMTAPRSACANDDLVARTVDLEALEGLISSSRLVTLTGPAGVGKSRLARVALARLSEKHRPIWGFAILRTTAASTLALPDWTTTSNGQFPIRDIESAKGQRTILLADDCEYFGEALPRFISELLSGLPNLTIVATKRAPLNLRGEVVWTVRPLDVVHRGREASPAASLFLKRLAARTPQRLLKQSEVGLLPDLCRCLDGIPLAIELAVAQVSDMTLPALLRLAQSTGYLDLPLPLGASPESTLRRSFDRSWSRLRPSEQATLRTLAVFPDSFDEVAARLVARASHIQRSASLADLAKRSFLQLDLSTGRYSMSNLMRRFALDGLSKREYQVLRTAHLDYFTSLTAEAGWFYDTSRESIWTRRLEPDEANLKTVMGWVLLRRPRQALQIGVGLAQCYAAWGRFTEAQEIVDTILKLKGDQELLSMAQFLSANCAMFARDYGRASRAFRTALSSGTHRGDLQAVARSALGLSTVSQLDGRLSDAIAYAKRAADIASQSGDVVALAGATNRLAYVRYLQKDYRTAERLFKQALSLARSAGSMRRAAIVLTNLGELAVSRTLSTDTRISPQADS